MATLLLELFSEEIPSRMQRGAAEQLQRLMLAGFEKNMLVPTSCKTFVSPRHLAIQCLGLPDVQPDMREERKGPKVGSPEQATRGFLQATGLTLEQCEQRTVGKDSYYFATIERKGQPTAEVVKKIIEETLSAFAWPKSMRWGARPLAWVRPLHRIVCLLDSVVVPVQFAHLTASNVTEGHRFLAPGEIVLAHAEKYEAALGAAQVMVDRDARRAKIAQEITALAATAKLAVVADEALLDEVTGLVEWPVPLLGTFDAKFLELPPEVLISEMKVHQRYFALARADGTLTNQFIAVANMVTADGGARVIAGNARVLRARLSDGEFYWEQDKKTSLESWGKKLADVVFHAKVGMMDAKVARIEALAVAIAKSVGFADEASVRRAAQLCKADLTSGMVGEFPELQGIMGRYYALAQGESAAVADAIRDHYKPLGANDSVPDAPLAAIVAVADKLDSIISLFAAGEKPTGSKDPLALRRAALGVLRTVLHHGWYISLNMLDSRFTQEVLSFMMDRLRVMLVEEGLGHDVIEAAFAEVEVDAAANAISATGHDYAFDALIIRNGAHTLSAWLESSAGKETLAAIKRAQNILAAEEKKAKQSYSCTVEKLNALAQPSEQALRSTLSKLNAQAPDDLNVLTAPINAFFDAVLVTEPEFREARLSLLAGVRDAANSIADFSKIEG